MLITESLPNRTNLISPSVAPSPPLPGCLSAHTHTHEVGGSDGGGRGSIGSKHRGVVVVVVVVTETASPIARFLSVRNPGLCLHGASGRYDRMNRVGMA